MADFYNLQWLVLYRGLATVITMKSYPRVQKSKVAPLFRRELSPLKTERVVPQILLEMVKEIAPEDPDFEYLESYCNALDALGILYAGLRQDGRGPALFVRAISWPSFTTQKFTDCAREARPRALIILAYYLVFIKMIPGLWWLDGTADFQIKMIQNMIEPEWWLFIDVPIEATFTENPEDLEYMLLR